MIEVEDSEHLPAGWVSVELEKVVGPNGVLSDGDWVETRHQDPSGNVRLVQLADIGEMKFLNKSNRFMNEKTAKELNCLFLKKDDLLIARLGEILGKACIYPANQEMAVTVVDVLVFRPQSMGIEPRFFGHFLSTISARKAIESQASGTTRKRITGKKLKQLRIKLPPAGEQTRIVSKIDELFSRVEAGEKALQRAKILVERYRKSVLNAAVTGELTKDWREKNKDNIEPADKLLERILKSRREAWEKSQLAKMGAKGKLPKDDAWKKRYIEPASPDTSELPDLPGGWVWSSIGQLFRVSVGSTPSRSNPNYWNGDIPWVSSGEVSFCKILRTKECISQEGFENSSTKLNPPGTVLIGMIGEGKTRGQVAVLGISASNNQNAAAILVAETQIPSLFIYLFLEGRYEESRGDGQGGNQPALNKSIVKSMMLPLPPLNEIEELVSIYEAKCSTTDKQLQDITAIELISQKFRKSILKTAFEGKLVPQDPSDEPASILLERVRSATSAAKLLKPRKGK